MTEHVDEAEKPPKAFRDHDRAVAPSHPEPCERCGGNNATWHAPSPLWNAVMRDPATGADDFGIVCPPCFAALADAKGFRYVWHFGPHEDVSRLWTDKDGRTWDTERCQWAAHVNDLGDPLTFSGSGVICNNCAFGVTAHECPQETKP